MESHIGQLRRALQDLEKVAKTSQGSLREVDPAAFADVVASISDAVATMPRTSACPVAMASFNALQLLTQAVTSSSNVANAALRLQACKILGFLFTSPTSGTHNAAATHAWMLKVLRNQDAMTRVPGQVEEAVSSSRPFSAKLTPESCPTETPDDVQVVASKESVDTLLEGEAGTSALSDGSRLRGKASASRHRRRGEDYSGVLLGAAGHTESEHSDPPRLGYNLLRMWYPRQLQAAVLNDLREIERAAKGEEDGRVEKSRRRGIREKMVEMRQTLPKKYLLEQGLEVAHCRQFMRVAFGKLFRHCERLLMRGALSRWAFKLRAAKYDEFKRRAGADKLKWVMKRHLGSLLPRVWAQWVAAADAIHREQQYAGATALQKVCRGVAGRVKFAIHKKRWMACIRVQKEWRRFDCVQAYKRCRTGAIEIQRQVRGYLIRLLIRKWHACATLIQSVVRMQPPFRYFLRLKVAVLLAQPRIRRAIAQRFFFNELHEFYKHVNRQVASAVRIQRAWNVHIAARTAAAQRAQQLLELNAALSLQRSWYRHKDQMAAYVLMRAIVVEEERGKVETILEKKQTRRRCAITIQCFFRAKTAQSKLKSRRRRYLSARTMQANVRRFIYTKRCRRLQIAHEAAKCIQISFRSMVLPYHTACCKIQKACLMYLTSLRRCRTQRVYAAFSRDEAVKRALAANTISRFARCLLARHEVRRRRGSALLQRWARGCLGYRRAARRAKSIHDSVVRSYVSGLVQKVRDSLAVKIADERTKSSIKLQGMYRRRKAQKYMVALRKNWKHRSRAALRIQCFFRSKEAQRTVKMFRLRRRNVFKSLTSVKSVVVESMVQASKLYDPFDPLAGIHIADLLFKLHLSHQYEKLQRIDMDTLLRYTGDDLWEAGVVREEEVQLLVAVIGVAKALDEMRTSWLNADKKRFGISEVEQPGKAVLQALRPITSDDRLLEAYLQYFPGQLTRAENFKSKVNYSVLSIHPHNYAYRFLKVVLIRFNFTHICTSSEEDRKRRRTTLDKSLNFLRSKN